MLTQDRYRAILDLLEEKNSVTVSELTKLLDSSESTIRRDLSALDEMGKLTKVFGVQLQSPETRVFLKMRKQS